MTRLTVCDACGEEIERTAHQLWVQVEQTDPEMGITRRHLDLHGLGCLGRWARDADSLATSADLAAAGSRP